MTIGTNNRNDAVGNDATTVYPYGFKIFAATDLTVTVRDLGGNETSLVYPTDFAVSGVGVSAGGNVTLNSVGASWQNADGTLKNGYAITIRRVVTVSQSTDIRNQGGFFADTHEDEFDYLTMIDQQQQDEIDRSIKLPETEAGSVGATTMPSAASRANRAFAFDSNGDILMVAINTTVYGVRYSRQLATEGQTVVTVPFSYVNGVNALAVYIDGWRMSPQGVDFTETGTTEFTMAYALRANQVIEAYGGQELTGTGVQDSASVQHTPAFGGVVTNVKDRLDAEAYLKDAGADPTGVGDSSAAFLLACQTASAKAVARGNGFVRVKGEYGAHYKIGTSISLAGLPGIELDMRGCFIEATADIMTFGWSGGTAFYNGTYYNLTTGSNATINNCADNGLGAVRVTTSAAHGYSDGDVALIMSVVGTTEANGMWKIRVIDTTNFDLVGSTFANAYTSGGTSRLPVYKPGDDVVTVATAADAANFAVGDFVYIRSRQTVSGSSNEPVAEMNRVIAVDAGTGDITLEWPLTKQHFYDSTYAFGISPANSYVTNGLRVNGGTWLNVYRRSFDLAQFFDVEIKGATFLGQGAATVRGCKIRIHHNVINLTPDGTLGYAPYYYAADTGTSEVEFVDNDCRTANSGYVHMMEGIGNMRVARNVFRQPSVARDASVTSFALFACRGLSWNLRITDNTVYNAVYSELLENLDSSVYAEASHDLEFCRNKIYGTVSGSLGDGVRLDTNAIGAKIKDNVFAAACSRYALYLTCGGAQVSGNDVRQNNSNIYESNIIEDDNIGLFRKDVFVPVYPFQSLSGTPAIGACDNGRIKGWLLDSASYEAVGGHLKLDAKAKKVTYYFLYGQDSAGAGDVVFTVDRIIQKPGFTNIGFVTQTQTVTIGAQYEVDESLIGTGDTITPALEGADLFLRLARDGANASDTLPNDICLAGVRVRMTAGMI